MLTEYRFSLRSASRRQPPVKRVSARVALREERDAARCSCACAVPLMLRSTGTRSTTVIRPVVAICVSLLPLKASNSERPARLCPIKARAFQQSGQAVQANCSAKEQTFYAGRQLPTRARWFGGVHRCSARLDGQPQAIQPCAVKVH